MVGGYDFLNGEGQWSSGDIFLDTNGSYYPADSSVSGSGNFGYEYVIDLNFSDANNLSYDVYKLDFNSATVHYTQNNHSNPWSYDSGGTWVANGLFSYQNNLSNADTGFLGDDCNNSNSHYLVSNIDLSFLGASQDFTAHFTMQCGNDNLMGSGTTIDDGGGPGGGGQVPEPGTFLLLGLGILGLAAGSRRLARK
ncbi:MAG: PEP-CTERM sorting domain-containing protein [Deltaproteobacteria bacterium]|nr:PEP-CTERM sorting domain-containing protein [Deltaproteobacteria bacterium]